MRTFLLIAVSFLSCGQAFAWKKQGHQIVGELAERQLSPATRAEVKLLLAGETEPTLAGVADWAEELRDNDPDLGKRSVRWHFINFPRGQPCTYVPARDCPDGNCVVAAINDQLKILADRRQPIAARQQALKFVVHFVGDVHQPLHAGFGDDRGGNDYQLNYNGEGTNLHSIWDYQIVRGANLETNAYADQLVALAPRGKDNTLGLANPAAEWALESCAIVEAGDFYPAKGKLDEAYLGRSRVLAERRLREAGDRLAALLESTLAGPAKQKE